MNNYYCPYDGGICYSSGCYFLSTPPICSKQATKSIPSEEQLKSESKEEDKIFIDGDFNNSYEARVKKATGKNMILSKEEYNKMQEEITRLKAELEKERELRSELWAAMANARYLLSHTSTDDLSWIDNLLKKSLIEKAKDL